MGARASHHEDEGTKFRGVAPILEATPLPNGQGFRGGIESRKQAAEVDAWRDWLAEGSPQLQLHVTLREPVGLPGLALLMSTALDSAKAQLGLDLCAVWGVAQQNSFRDGLHAHALMFGPPALQQVRRSVMWGEVREKAATLHRLAPLPGEVQEPNSAFVRILPVTLRGGGVESLTAYIVRYMLDHGQGDWFEAGELGRWLRPRTDV